MDKLFQLMTAAAVCTALTCHRNVDFLDGMNNSGFASAGSQKCTVVLWKCENKLRHVKPSHPSSKQCKLRKYRHWEWLLSKMQLKYLKNQNKCRRNTPGSVSSISCTFSGPLHSLKNYLGWKEQLLLKQTRRFKYFCSNFMDPVEIISQIQMMKFADSQCPF